MLPVQNTLRCAADIGQFEPAALAQGRKGFRYNPCPSTGIQWYNSALEGMVHIQVTLGERGGVSPLMLGERGALAP